MQYKKGRHVDKPGCCYSYKGSIKTGNEYLETYQSSDWSVRSRRVEMKLSSPAIEPVTIEKALQL